MLQTIYTTRHGISLRLKIACMPHSLAFSRPEDTL
jgi:hypothetical protein